MLHASDAAAKPIRAGPGQPRCSCSAQIPARAVRIRPRQNRVPCPGNRRRPRTMRRRSRRGVPCQLRFALVREGSAAIPTAGDGAGTSPLLSGRIPGGCLRQLPEISGFGGDEKGIAAELARRKLVVGSVKERGSLFFLWAPLRCETGASNIFHGIEHQAGPLFTVWASDTLWKA